MSLEKLRQLFELSARVDEDTGDAQLGPGKHVFVSALATESMFVYKRALSSFKEEIMGADENLRKAKDLYAAFDRGEIDTIISALPDNAAWSYNSSVENDIPWFGTHNGPSKVREEFFGAIAEAVDIQSFERKSFVASGDQVAVFVSHRGDDKKEREQLR